jgi:hypothetical protein
VHLLLKTIKSSKTSIMDTSRFFRRNQSKIVWGTLILTSLAFSSNDIKYNLQQITQIKEGVRENSEKLQDLGKLSDFVKLQAEVAEERYKAGCLILADKDGRFINLQQGQTVVDPVKGTPLAKYTVVCDASGNTGVLLPRDFDGDGRKTTVAADIAFTGNRSIVEKAINKAVNRSNYASPVQ